MRATSLKSFAELQARLYPDKAKSRKQVEVESAWKQHKEIQRLVPPEQRVVPLSDPPSLYALRQRAGHSVHVD